MADDIKKETYESSVPLAAGLEPYNNQDYALLDAHYVWIQDGDDKTLGIRLDEKLKNIGNTDLIEEQINTILIPLQSQVQANTSQISSNSSNIAQINLDISRLEALIPDAEELNKVRDALRVHYEESESLLYLYWVEFTDGAEDTFEQAKEKEHILSETVIKGGGGGSDMDTAAVKLTILESQNITQLYGNEVIIKFLFQNFDSDNIEVALGGSAKLYVNNELKEQKRILPGENSFNITTYLKSGDNTIRVSVTNDDNRSKSATWTVKYVDMRITSSFDDTKIYTDSVSIYYTPYGGISKNIYLEIDGTIVVKNENITTSNRQLSFLIPQQTHGDHEIKLWMEALINGYIIKSNVLFYDAIWIEEGNTTPIIRANYDGSPIEQYATKVIEYNVYDPTNELSEINFYIDNSLTGTDRVDRSIHTFSYKPLEKKPEGETVNIKFQVKDTIKQWNVQIIDFPYDISPVTAGLQFDFDPTGRSNSEINNRDKYTYTGQNGHTYNMTVSNNFDWYNGGWKLDENNISYFKVMAGDRVSFDYPLYGDDTKGTGKNFKFIFKTENCRSIKAEIIRCYAKSETDEQIGMIAQAQNAYFYNGNTVLNTPYAEDTLVELEFNIQRDKTGSAAEYAEMTVYQASDPSRCALYDSAANFNQTNIGSRIAQPITLGSDECDLRIYRIKAYDTSLTMDETFQNYMADSLNPEDMAAKYRNNDILDDSGELDYEKLSKLYPNLRIILITCPRFTHDKKDGVSGCTVQQIMGTGDEYHNWIADNVVVKGQGTSSNEYGSAARNFDLNFKNSTFKSTVTEKPIGPVDSVSGEHLGPVAIVDDEGKPTGEYEVTKKYAMTSLSIPVNYINVKVNVASSENANNACLADDYNNYQPYRRPIRQANPKVRDCMEFHPCVVFLQETGINSEGVSVVPEQFEADGKFHFYACGDFGNSKKNNEAMGMLLESDGWKDTPNADLECIIEVGNNTAPACLFQRDASGNGLTRNIFNGNELVDDWDGDVVEFRYPDAGSLLEVTDETKLQVNKTRLQNIANKFVDMWEWVNSTCVEEATGQNLATPKTYNEVTYTKDTEEYRLAKFKAEYTNYLVKDSMLYHLLFIERHTMIDNLAKNTFIHYNVNGPEAGKWDWIFNYDNDTGDGNDNSGGLTFTYGKEIGDVNENASVDAVDKPTEGQSSRKVFNADTSVVWYNTKAVLLSELEELSGRSEVADAWDGNRIIEKFNNYQWQKPERLEMLDMWRKYLRPYEGYTTPSQTISGDTRYLNMLYGRKTLQRQSYETYQNVYFGTEYFVPIIKKDILRFRSYRKDYIETNGIANVLPTPDGIAITPFSDLYVIVDYDQVIDSRIRTKAGQTVYSQYAKGGANALSDTNIRIYAGGFISSMGDLAPYYLGETEFGRGKKLLDLIVGSEDSRYRNTGFQGVSLENAALLTYLDVSNNTVSTGNPNIDAKNSPNLLEVYSTGSNVKSVEFANGGLLKKAKLNAVNALIMRNLVYLEEFSMEGYENLSKLYYENCPDNVTKLGVILKDAPYLNTVRLMKINLSFADSTILNKLAKAQGISADGASVIPQSVLTGKVKLATVRQAELDEYSSIWNVRYLTAGENFADIEPNDTELVIAYDRIQPQGTIIFRNWDGTELYRTLVDYGSIIPDPVALGYISTPEKESTTQYSFTYNGWDRSLNIGPSETEQTIIITATYLESLRKYTINWYNDDETNSARGIIDTQQIFYGGEAVYAGETGIPQKNDAPGGGTSYLFNGWDKSTGYITGNMDVYPLWQAGNTPPATPAASNTFTPAQLKNLVNKKLDTSDMEAYLNTDVSSVTFDFGYMPTFTNIEEEVLVEKGSPLILTGSNFFDTGIQLLKEDKSWVLALDITAQANGKFSCLVSCGDSDLKTGLWISYAAQTGAKPEVHWQDGDSIPLPRAPQEYSTTTGTNKRTINKAVREIVVLRHIKGDNKLYVYINDRESTDSITGKTSSVSTYTTENTLIFGSEKNGKNKAVGRINYAKLWKGDLGDNECKEIASWIYDSVEMRFVGFNRYTLANGNGSCTATFTMTNNTLDVLHRSYNGVAGGWKYSEMRTYFTKKILKGVSPLWKQILAEVNVYGRKGGHIDGATISGTTPDGTYATTADNDAKKTAALVSKDKLYAASAYEINMTGVDESYKNEVLTSLQGNAQFACFPDNNSRIGRYPTMENLEFPWFTRSVVEDNMYAVLPNGALGTGLQTAGINNSDGTDGPVFYESQGVSYWALSQGKVAIMLTISI